jgi:FkbM family methyltransferase
MDDENIHKIPLPFFIRAAIRKTLLVPYKIATPYLNAPISFPDNRKDINSYSYHFEDILIDSILGNKRSGRYIDIGANDPVFRNNTKRFSLKGWNGINVEPCINKFIEILADRPKDININAALSDTDGLMPFYILDWEMASTLDESVAKHHCKEYETTIREVVDISVMRFDTFMKKYNGTLPIDFISMDMETHELKTLKTNDWNLYRPTLFCIELCYDLSKETTAYMESKGYHPLFMTEENAFYIDNEVRK